MHQAVALARQQQLMATACRLLQALSKRSMQLTPSRRLLQANLQQQMQQQ
jgi:hypothetical protein